MSHEQKAFEEFFKNLNYNIENVEKGRVLISEPFLSDPNFSRTVVFLVKHNSEGSLGFVLNQESEFLVSEALPDFPEFDAYVNLGGPVGTENLFYLHTRPDLIEGGVEILDGLYWGGDFEQLKKAISDKKLKKEDVNFFVGYSGWEAGQLERELKDNSWIVTQTSTSEVMSQQGEKLWAIKMRTLGEKFRIMANFPADPNMN